MRIAFLTSEFVTEPTFAGGLAQYLGRVTTGLVKRGHQVEVFVTSETNGEFDYQGVIVRRVVLQRWLPLKGANFLLRLMHRQRLIESQLACSIALALNNAFCERASKVRFDIVQAASWCATGFFASKNPLVPVVVRVSSYEPLLRPERGCQLTMDTRLYSRIELAAIRQATAVYAPSKFLAAEILKRTGIKVQVVRPPFYSSNGFAESGSTIDVLDDWANYLLYFGRVSRYKGAGILARSIEPFFERFPEFCLAIAGDVCREDPAAKRLLGLTKSRPRRVRYLGALPNEKLMGIIKKARAVVLPSLMDNLPNTCLEAMAMGKVVVGPNGVSFDELIADGRSGILFEKGDFLSLRHAILQAWNLPEAKRSAIAKCAKAQIALMAPEISLSNLEKFYQNVILQYRNS